MPFKIPEFSHQIRSGSSKNELEAAKAYDRAAKLYHKEFAFLNFPSE
jgi:hypothetical protein